MNWPLLSGGVFALALHAAVLFWLTWSPEEASGLAMDDGLYGLDSGVGMLGSYSETSNRIDAVLTPPEPVVDLEPVPEPKPKAELPELALPEPAPEPVTEVYRQPEPEPTPEPEAPTEPEPVTAPEETNTEVAEAEETDADSTAEQTQEASTSARRASGSAEQQANGGRRGNASNYVQTLNQWLARHRTYPPHAKRSKLEGTVRLAFTMNREGEILSSHIAGSSGHVQLDEAALQMLENAAPLPAVPDDFFPSRETLPLVMPIEYSLITNTTFGD